MYRFHTVHCITYDSQLTAKFGYLRFVQEIEFGTKKKQVKIDYKNKLKGLVNVVVGSVNCMET